MTNLSFYRGKRVFLTGHTGFKGTWLAHTLLIAGAKVTGYGLAPPSDPSLFALTGLEDRMTSIIADVRDIVTIKAAIRKAEPEIIFHLAAQPLVRLSYKEPVYTYETNVMGTVHLLEAVRETPSVRSLVNITTDKVYENKEWHWGYRENENLCGYDPYSNSKSCSELLTSSYRNSFFHTNNSPAVSTARSGNVIGGGDYAEDRIIPDCVRAVQAGEVIYVRNPHSIRPYQHVLECLSGYLLLAKRQYEDKQAAGAYNFGPNEKSCVSTGYLVELFCRACKGASWKIQGDGGPHEANFLKLDCSKSTAVLGWEPKWDIQKAIEKVIEWNECVKSGQLAIGPTETQILDFFTI